MFYLIIEIFASFLEIYFLFCVFNLFFEKRTKNKFYYYAIFLSSIIITLLTTYLNNITLYSYSTLCIWNLTAILFGFILHKCNPIKLCSISLLYIVIISSFDFLFLIFVEYILQSPDFVYAVLNGNCIERVMTLVISKSALTLSFLFIRFKKYKISVSLISSILLILFSILSFASMQYLITIFFSNQQDNVQTIILVAFAFMSLSFVSILLILNSHEKIKFKASEKELIETKLKLSEERNNKIIETYREIAKLSHDYNNQIKVIYQLLVNGKSEAAIDYLSQLAKLNTSKSFCYTGIHSIDAVLSEKNRASLENKITINYDIAVTSINGIKEIDICTILLNLLDNSIEACSKINDTNDKIINVLIKNVNSMLFIKIENPVTPIPTLPSKPFLIKTSKKNKDIHGFGLLIVNSIAQKYNSSLKIKNENGIFTSTLLLSN